VLNQTDPIAMTGPTDSRSAERVGIKASGDQLASEVDEKYRLWRSARRPYEGQWLVNAALVRGIAETQFSPLFNRVEMKASPARERAAVNRVLQKTKARLSKFLKTRAIPIVTPASTDRDDIMNARGTEKVLQYIWRRIGMESKHEDVLLWAFITGKAFWWFYWDEGAIATVKEPDGLTRKGAVMDVPLGDIACEVGTAYELLVSNPSIMRLRDQPEIMRCKVRPIKEVAQRYKLQPDDLVGDTTASELFQYERQIAALGARGTNSRGEETKDHVTVKELFTRPCAEYPKGRYSVTAGGRKLRAADELPFGLWRKKDNPYPCVEFADMLSPGQFWPTTYVEQMQWLQKDYNRNRAKVSEHVKAEAHGKWFVPKQSGLTEDSINSEPAQVIPYTFQPNLPSPSAWVVRPGNISSDVWRLIDLGKTEFDDVTNLPPSSMGMAGATSGFDTNLLQEAADSVHAPDIRRNEVALEEAFFIMRRLAKIGYDIPRLITITGKDNEPDVFEFSADEIDEHANIKVETGSNLPKLTAARINTVKELWGAGIFGNPQDPNVQRKVLRLLDIGFMEEAQVTMHRDEEQARFENLQLMRGQPVEDPQPWESHQLHADIHADSLKSPEFKRLPPEAKMAATRHWVLTVKWINPQSALQLATILGMADIAQAILAEMQPPPGAVPGAMPPPQADPAGQPPQAAPPPPASDPASMLPMTAEQPAAPPGAEAPPAPAPLMA
jgi:hypothetical protein